MNNSIQLKKACNYSSNRISIEKVSCENFVSTDNLLQNKGGITTALSLPPQGNFLAKYNKEDILVSNIRPYLKKIWFSDKTGGCSADVLVFEVKKGYHPNFIYYAMFRDDFFKHAMKGSKGTKMPRGDKNQLMEFEIPDFNFTTQQTIASVLSSLDSKVNLNNRINTELEAMAKTLYDYWFVQFDFPDENGKPYKSSGGKMVWSGELKREIPEGWETKELSPITPVSNEQLNPSDSPDKDFKHYSIPAFDELGTYKIEKGVEIKSNKFIIKDTDVLVSKLNPWFNRVVFSTNDEDLIASTEFVVWRPKNFSLKNYLYSIARDISFITFCTQSASGTSHSHRRVIPTVMMNYQIPYKEEIAERFGNLISPINKMKSKNKIENQQLSSLRDWLLPMLMNGQVKVGSGEEKKIGYKISEETKIAAEHENSSIKKEPAL
jgi:type I restriction enzyme S subunit